MNRNSTDLFTTIASLTRKLSLSALLAFSLGNPAWSQAKTAEIVGKPTVYKDRVTVRIKVKDANDKPVMGLQDTNFSLIVDRKPLKFRGKDWKSPDETIPPPAFIIVLLDYSGSMQQKDSQGTSKIEGALKAIKEFTTELGNRCPKNSTVECPTPKVSIVPFGDPGPACEGNPVNQKVLAQKIFLPANSFQLNDYLDSLAAQKPCASTNIYEPLSKSIQFLATDPSFSVPEDSKQPQPRLSVVLLSDGYHNKPNEERDFNNLLALLKRNEKITVHTLGYGFTPAQLGQKYGLGRPAKRSDIGKGDRKVPEEVFVDENRLAEIAKVTGGIAEFSPNSQAVAEKLKLFLNALLGEYEISYEQPNAEKEKGSKHDVEVVVQSDLAAKVQSESASYRIEFFWPSLPLNTRIIMLLAVLVAIGAGGVLPFWLWANHLKQEMEN